MKNGDFMKTEGSQIVNATTMARATSYASFSSSYYLVLASYQHESKTCLLLGPGYRQCFNSEERTGVR